MGTLKVWGGGDQKSANTQKENVLEEQVLQGYAERILAFEDRKDSPRGGHPGAVAELDKASRLGDVLRDQAMGCFG